MAFGGGVLFHRFSDSMQIESLWNFNKKYDPQWVPRYSVADDRAHLPRAGLAIARAEAVSELPLVGRFMKPKTPAARSAPKEPCHDYPAAASDRPARHPTQLVPDTRAGRRRRRAAGWGSSGWPWS